MRPACLSEAPGGSQPAVRPRAGRSRLTWYMLHSPGWLRACGPGGLLLCLSLGTCQRDRVAPESARARAGPHVLRRRAPDRGADPGGEEGWRG